MYRSFMPAQHVTLLALAGLLAACAHPRGAAIAAGGEAARAPEASCLLSTGDVTARAPTITIGLSDAVDPRHAPYARTDAERVVFRHLYETPVRIDCDGHVLPGLADRWEKADGGRRWTFHLREDAQFWDGAPVTAQDIVFGRSGVGYTLGAPDKSTVALTFAKERDDVPSLLGDPSLAVTKPAPDSSWPIGTGAYWATSVTTTAQEIRAHTTHGDTLVFKFAASGDARDLLDAGVDLLVTRDRALRDYAATLPNHAVVPLPWDRTYVFVAAEAGGTRLDGGGLEGLEQAVRAEARRAEGDFWWRDLRACGMVRDSAPPAPTAQRRILYSRGDPTARELAGRLAALTHAVATGRAPDDFRDALAGGKDGGYVVALPRVTADGCRSARDLLPAWPASFTTLVDTRPTAIVRRGVARWAVDQDGAVHLVP